MQSKALVIVLGLAFFGAAIVASPLWVAIVFGGVLAVSAARPYGALCKRVRPSLAAGLTTLGVGLMAALACAFVLVSITNELVKLVAHLNAHSRLDQIVGERTTHVLERAGVDTMRLYAWLQQELAKAATFFATTAALIVRTTSHAILGLVVALMTMYYALVEGPDLSRRIERLLPLQPRHTRELLTEAKEVARTAFVGTIATAIVQGLLAGLGYTILGVPQPVTWAVVTAIASFLPVIGTLIVWVPISGYLLLEGHPFRALFLAIYGVIIITSLADYVIRPRIVGRDGHGHPLLTLIALLGGIEVFGLGGLVIAPIVMSVFVAAFRLYERELPELRSRLD